VAFEAEQQRLDLRRMMTDERADGRSLVEQMRASRGAHDDVDD
jgi:hypothetical protein